MELSLVGVVVALVIGVVAGYIFSSKKALAKNTGSQDEDSNKKAPEEKKVKKVEEKPFKAIKEEKKIVKHSTCISEIKGLPRASSVSFDPKGRYLAATCDDRTIRLFQYETLGTSDHKQYKINVEGDVPSFCRFSPDGHYLLVAMRDSQSFWVYKIFSHRDATTGKPYEIAREYPQRHSKGLLSLQMSQNQKYVLTCGADTSLLLWNVKGEVIATLNSRQMGNNGAAMSSDSTLLAAATLMADVRVWKIKEGAKGEFVSVDDKNFTALTGKNAHKAGVNSVSFTHNGLFAFTSSKDNTIKKWTLNGDFKLGFEPDVVFTGTNPAAEKNGYGILAVNADDDRVAVVSGRNIHLWSVGAKSIVTTIENAHGGEIADMQWSQDGKLLATACTDSTVRVFKL